MLHSIVDPWHNDACEAKSSKVVASPWAPIPEVLDDDDEKMLKDRGVTDVDISDWAKYYCWGQNCDAVLLIRKRVQ